MERNALSIECDTERYSGWFDFVYFDDTKHYERTEAFLSIKLTRTG